MLVFFFFFLREETKPYLNYGLTNKRKEEGEGGGKEKKGEENFPRYVGLKVELTMF